MYNAARYVERMITATGLLDPLPIKAFLSYSRQDNRDFGVVTPFVEKLRALVKAKSGRQLEVFVDEVNIEWGADWRQKLADGVQEALIFIPLLSANYVASQSCRDEFLAFYNKAQVLGVTELLLPVLLFQSPIFHVDSDDEVIALSASRQWEVIEDALLSGAASPEFLKTMSRLAGALLDSLSKAEMVIASGLESSTSAAGEDTGTSKNHEPGSTEEQSRACEDAENSDVEEPLLSELMIRFQDGVEEMNAAAEELSPAIEALGGAVKSAGELGENPTPKQAQAWALRLAHAFKAPAQRLESGGKRLFDAVRNVDESIGGLRSLATQAGDEFGEPINAGLDEALSNFGDLSEVEAVMTGLLDSLRPGELFSVPLRASLRPARRGLTRITDSLRIIAGWRQG